MPNLPRIWNLLDLRRNWQDMVHEQRVVRSLSRFRQMLHCGGTGIQSCTECGGKGIVVHWKYTIVGSATVISVFSVLVLLGSLGLAYAFSGFRLDFNEWVYDVEDMQPWFNPSFMTWVFAKDRARWFRWEIGIAAPTSLFMVVVLFTTVSLRVATPDTIIWGSGIALIIASTFAFILYKACTSTSPETRSFEESTT